MNNAVIIQARTGSVRLPNKVLLPFHNNKNILEIIIDKVLKVFDKKYVIVATTLNKNDIEIINLAKSKKVNYFAGSESNVLERFINAADNFDIKKIIRICSDNPFLDLDSLRFLKEKLQRFNGDYIAFCDKNSCPTISKHYGLWAEGVSIKALKLVAEKTNDSYFTEHVTNYIYSHKNDFSIELIQIPLKFDSNEIRFTVDSLEDFNHLKILFNDWTKKGSKNNIESLYNLVNNNKKLKNEMKKQIIKNEK